MNKQLSVLLFSRGRGHGHAIPDMAIVDEVTARVQNVAFQFASYSTGAETLRGASRPVHDLGLPENNAYLATLFKAVGVMEEVRPDIVICHEEFAAIAAARVRRVPAIFISAWLPITANIAAESLQYVHSVLVLENPGIFQVPPGVTAPVHHVGPILRKLKYTRADRTVLRREMRIPESAIVVLVVPGGAASEEQMPLADVVVGAFGELSGNENRLFWLSRKDFCFMQQRLAGVRGGIAIEFADPIERWLSVADVIITKGTRGITLDAAVAGVPSLSLSNGTNPIDDLLVPRIHSNVALNAKAVTSSVLAHYLKTLIAAPRLAQPFPLTAGAEEAARILIQEFSRLTPWIPRAVGAQSA